MVSRLISFFAWIWYFKKYQDCLPPPPIVFFKNAFMFWMDDFEIIIGPVLMSLMEVGNFYWTMYLIIMFPYYKNWRNPLLLKTSQRGLGLGDHCAQRDLMHQNNLLNQSNVIYTLPCNFLEHLLNAGLKMTMICRVLSILQLPLAWGLLNPCVKQSLLVWNWGSELRMSSFMHIYFMWSLSMALSVNLSSIPTSLLSTCAYISCDSFVK